MKRLFILAAAVVMAVAVNAQKEVGTWSFAPKAGITLNQLAGDGDKNAIGFVAGVEAQNQLTEKFAMSAGVLYANKGTKMEGADKKMNMNYINVPILANYYVVSGLAVKAGLQPGYLVSAKCDGDDFADGCKKFDLCIPVGLSYEFKNFVIDARYDFGLTKTFKDGEDGQNRGFLFTIGYQF